MYVPFEELPPESKIWIYQSNRKFSEDEVQLIEQKSMDFVNQWAAHGNSLQASFLVKYNRFIIFAVDQTAQMATGCSIDASVAFIQDLEREMQVELLDKMNVTYKTGEFIAFKSLIDFKKMAKEKAVNENTIVFNNLVNTVGEWYEYWEVPASESWHARFF
uniref:ABC transporter ATPase n=1 Tax=Flavobacterium sp. TaxID=239 RepID=UPI00404A721B